VPIETSGRIAAVVTWLLAGALTVVGLVLLRLSVSWPLVHDAPILHYIAQRIAAGAGPYRDLFDMNQPGAYLIHLGLLRVAGAGDAAWRAFDIGWLAVTCAVVFAFARAWGAAAGAGAAALFGTYHVAGGAWQAGQRDFLLCVFLLGASAVIASWGDSRPAGWRLALAGALLGAGITLKPHALAFACGLGVLVVFAAVRRRAAVRALAMYAAGLCLPPAVVLAWLAARGGLRAWRDIVVDYLVPLYSRLTRPEDWAFWRVEVWFALGAAALVSVGAAAWYGRFDWRRAIAVMGLGYGVLHFVGQRKGWEYHLYPLAAFASVLAFSEVEALVARRRVVLGGLVALSLLASGATLARRGHDTVAAGWVRDKEAVVTSLVDDLARRWTAADTIQVLDTTEGGVHALLRLGAQTPTRFLYDFHFFHDVRHPTIQGLRDELVRDLAARRPRFVVLFERGWPAGGLDRFEHFPALARFLESRYRTTTRRAGYVILERHGS
jgi:hypothetical protein